MGTFNFHPDHNTPHKVVFCTWEDHDKYKEETIEEYGEEEASAYSDWYELEKGYYMEQLKEDLKASFGYDVDVASDASDGGKVCEVGNCFAFAGMEFRISVGIFFEVGYYEGFALDWKIVECCDAYITDLPDREEAVRLLEYTSFGNRNGLNVGLSHALAPKFIKRCEKELAEITDKIDAILMNLAPHNMEIGWCCSEHKTSA